MTQQEIDDIRSGDVLGLGDTLSYLVLKIESARTYEFTTWPLAPWQQKDGIHQWSSKQFLRDNWHVLIKADAHLPGVQK